MDNRNLLGDKVRLTLLEIEQERVREQLNRVKETIEEMLVLYTGLCNTITKLCDVVRERILEEYE